jgi:hypothetical protein
MLGTYADWLKGLTYSRPCIFPRSKNFLGMSTNGHYLRVAPEIRTDDLKQIVQTTMWQRLAQRLQ